MSTWENQYADQLRQDIEALSKEYVLSRLFDRPKAVQERQALALEQLRRDLLDFVGQHGLDSEGKASSATSFPTTWHTIMVCQH